MLILDASMALAWIFARSLKTERDCADRALHTMHRDALLLLARKYSLTAYDACYLELTLRLAATLATFDRKLASATLTAGGDVFV